MKLFHHDLKEVKCLKCEHVLETATANSPDTSPREQGAMSFCSFCGHLAMFTPELKLSELTVEEMAQVNNDAETAAFLRQARAMIKLRAIQRRKRFN